MSRRIAIGATPRRPCRHVWVVNTTNLDVPELLVTCAKCGKEQPR